MREAAGGVQVLGRFDLAAFDPRLFADLGIEIPERLGKAVAKRQAEFLAGRVMAKLAQEALGFAAAPVAIGTDRAPEFAAGVAGSISHARGRCACFLVPEALGHPGIDIEAITDGKALRSIQRMVLQPDENTIIAQGAMPVAEAATLTFSAKETLYKALHPVVQAFFGFSAAELACAPADGVLTLRLMETLHASLSEGREFRLRYEVADGHVLTWLLYHPE